MKGRLSFDPAQCDYGPATGAVRQILTEWADIDWFEPLGDRVDARRAVALMHEHNALAFAQLPDDFPVVPRVDVVIAGWGEFAVLCERARALADWSWKFSALKKLAHHHFKARGWSRKELIRDQPDLAFGGRSKPGVLFERIGNMASVARFFPTVDLTSVRPPARRSKMDWYLSFAIMDLVECIEWQLAERNDLLESNPFISLLRCYAAGFLPFGIDRDTLVLFGLR